MRKTDIFANADRYIGEIDLSTPPEDDTFDTFRGVLLATFLGLPLWAGVLLLCLRIW